LATDKGITDKSIIVRPATEADAPLWQTGGATRVRLVADDLTGALDTAAQFVARSGPMPVFWTHPATLPPSAAFDTGTREQGPAEAAAKAATLARILDPSMPASTPPPRGMVAFKKLDSLLRGHSGQELAAILRALLAGPACPARAARPARPALRCVVAPAFPFQGRVTRGGRQYARTAEGWQKVGEDLQVTLDSQGLDPTPARRGDPVPDGISLWDAETEDDLRWIAEAGSALDAPILWCGRGGLAGALVGPQRPLLGALGRPVLGLFGSDHPVTATQLAAAEAHCLRLPDGGAASAAILSRRLASTGIALVRFDLPELSRPQAAVQIAHEMASLTRLIAPPGTLVVAGGETLRALCLALKATHLEVRGQITPGVPRAILRGGRWDGTEVVSKSGAFGEAGLLRQLIALGTPQQEQCA
jgi:D-threonate/D-erythronate kinase